MFFLFNLLLDGESLSMVNIHYIISQCKSHLPGYDAALQALLHAAGGQWCEAHRDAEADAAAGGQGR
jgi:hypothetical protein